MSFGDINLCGRHCTYRRERLAARALQPRRRLAPFGLASHAPLIARLRRRTESEPRGSLGWCCGLVADFGQLLPDRTGGENRIGIGKNNHFEETVLKPMSRGIILQLERKPETLDSQSPQRNDVANPNPP